MTLDATLPQASTSNTHLHSLHEYARTHCHFRSSLLTPLLEEAVAMRPVESASFYPWRLDPTGTMILCAGVYTRCWNTEDFVCILMTDIPQTFLQFFLFMLS